MDRSASYRPYAEAKKTLPVGPEDRGVIPPSIPCLAPAPKLIGPGPNRGCNRSQCLLSPSFVPCCGPHLPVTNVFAFFWAMFPHSIHDFSAQRMKRQNLIRYSGLYDK